MKSNKKIRTRYAPSPTGYFHVGGARTALFNYLFAKHNDGDFIVRIEDTDIKRNVEDGIKSQLTNLAWLGIKIDESIENPGKYGPYIQTAKLERYKELAFKLLKEKKAYYCFCSPADLQKARQQALEHNQTPKYNRHCLNLSQSEIEKNLASGKPYVIRLKMPDNHTFKWNDLIRGEISVPSSSLTDPVILKSNFYPMYNFAVVVDDYDMDITHVIRGEEHISNTPYQIAIKEALGFDKKDIQYGHLSVIVNKDGKKLSKRDSSLRQFIQDYKDMGFYPHAITNFLALLGWSPKSHKEIMTMDEMIKDFDITHVSKAPTFFDMVKMCWVSNKYIANLDDQAYLRMIKPFAKEINWKDFAAKSQDILLLFKKQITYCQEITSLVKEHFYDYQIEKIDKKSFQNSWWKILDVFCDELKKQKLVSYDVAKEIINQTGKIAKCKGPNLFMPIRLAITSKNHGPELFKILFILGNELVLERIANLKKIYG